MWRAFSVYYILNFTLAALSYIDSVPSLIVSSGFNFKGSTRCLAGEFINNSYASAFFTMELATLIVTLIQ